MQVLIIYNISKIKYAKNLLNFLSTFERIYFIIIITIKNIIHIFKAA